MTEPQITEADREKTRSFDELVSRNRENCSLGVGCDETGVCYADAHGYPEKCGRNRAPLEARIAELSNRIDLANAASRMLAEQRDKAEARIAELERHVAGLTAALELIDSFAWSAVRADCEEAREELMRRIGACRQAFTDHGAASLARHEAEVMERAAQRADAWSVPANVKLAAGEMTAQELRTAQAVARGIAAAIRAAKPSGDRG